MKIIITIAIFLTVFAVAYAAPSSQSFRTLLPTTDSTYDLGSAVKRWANVYTDNIDATTMLISGSSTGDLDGGGFSLINWKNLTLSGTLGVTGASTLATTTISGNLAVNTNQLYVDTSTGRVGIGTSTPSKKLNILSTGSDQLRLSYSASKYTDFWVSSAGNIYVQPSGGTLYSYGNVDISGGIQSNYGATINNQQNNSDTRISGVSDVNLFYADSSTDRIGIGTTAPSQKLDVAGNINISAGSSLKIAGTDVLTASTTNSSVTLGQNAGANLGATALYNTAIGINALKVATSSNNNTAVGYQALKSNTTGANNTVQGTNALYFNTTGGSNSTQGVNSLFYNTTGSNNSVQGFQTLYSNTTGSNNSVQGYGALNANTTGSNLTAQGYQAGRYITGGAIANATSSTSLYLGALTKALASGDTNEIVIGYGAVGVGSNSVVLGNSSVATTVLRGNVGIGNTSPSYKLDISGTLNATGAVTLGSTLLVSGQVDLGLDVGGGKFNSYKTTTGTSGTEYNTVIRQDSLPTSPSTLTNVALYTQAQHHGNATVGISGLTSLKAVTTNSDTTTVINSKGIDVSVTQNLGTLTNTYGVYVGDITTGTQTNTPFSFYASDANTYNYFAGNVGIGTTNPNTYGEGATTLAVYGEGSNLYVGDNTDGVRLEQSGATSALRFGNYTTGGASAFLQYNRATGKLQYSEGIEGSRDDFFTIGNTGNVGIGTTAPVGKLDVYGQTTDAVSLVSKTNATDAGLKLAFFGANRSTADEEMAAIRPLLVSNNGGAGNVQLGQLAFDTSGVERMRIDKDGNVGIGTTTPGALLTVDNGDIYVASPTKGIILTSPDGTCARGTIDNSDVLTFASVTCP